MRSWHLLARFRDLRAQHACALYQPARHEEHDQRERRAVGDQAKIADAAQHLGQQRKQDRAPHRSDQRAHAAHDDHRQHREGFGDEECIGHQRADEGPVETAGGAGHCGADPECERLPGGGIDAERGRRDLVLADRGERLADRRSHQPIEQDIGRECKARDQVEQVGRLLKVDHRQARQGDRGRRWNPVDAERPLGHADPVQQDLIGDDGEAERCDREIVAAQAHREQRQDYPGEACGCDRGGERDPERHGEARRQQHRDIGADAVERRLPEVELARIAEHEIKPQRQQHVDRADGQVGLPIAARQHHRQRGDRKHGGEERHPPPRRRMAAQAAGSAGRDCALRHSLRASRR